MEQLGERAVNVLGGGKLIEIQTILSGRKASSLAVHHDECMRSKPIPVPVETWKAQQLGAPGNSER